MAKQGTKAAKQTARAQRARTSSTRYQDLVRIATELFAREGYERTTVRAIADEMGIESGSLYSHISSKEDLLLEIVVASANEFFRRADLARQADGSAEQVLRGLCRAHMSVLSDERAACQVYFEEWRKLSPRHQQEIIALRKQYEEIFRTTISEGIADGSFGAVDPYWGALVVLSALNWTSEWYAPKGRLSSEQVADAMLDVILPGLRAR